jgi:hypothetical protein
MSKADGFDPNSAEYKAWMKSSGKKKVKFEARPEAPSPTPAPTPNPKEMAEIMAAKRKMMMNNPQAVKPRVIIDVDGRAIAPSVTIPDQRGKPHEIQSISPEQERELLLEKINAQQRNLDQIEAMKRKMIQEIMEREEAPAMPLPQKR